VPIDNNAVVGRNNWLFCGDEESGRRAALAYSVIESCKAAGVKPLACIADAFAAPPASPPSRPPRSDRAPRPPAGPAELHRCSRARGQPVALNAHEARIPVALLLSNWERELKLPIPVGIGPST
jgi:hypothetical protein